MSKIADALRKIQDERSAQSSDERDRKHRKIGRIEVNHADGSGTLDDTAVLSSAVQRKTRVVQIDRDAMRDAGLIAPEPEFKLFEDEYRVIKRPILANAFGSNSATVARGYIVLVTSALSGDGKTFTCINLALSLARERDTSVMLVDADIPKPHISTLFDAQDEPGFLDYLDGSVSSLDDIELPTNVDGLTILPTGKSRADATELLSGSRMAKFVEQVHGSDPHKIILIDSSPLLQTTESRALAAASGQVVVVVHAGITPKGAVLDAVATLDSDKPINLILNQVRFGHGSNYYSSYYGGAYGQTQGESDVLET